MSTAAGIAAAVTFVWLGMVLAISFLEAPLKFGAPGVTLPIGLGIGRRVFRALNAVEVLLVIVLAVAVLLSPPGLVTMIALAGAIGCLILQLAAVRPSLARRSNAVLAGEIGPRSHAHYWYVGLELLKVVALASSGVRLLAR